MAAVMVRFLANLLGHVRGGLHYVLVAAMYLVSGISGSKAADMAAIAPALFPEMETARRRPRRPGGAAGRNRRADRNHSAEPDPDHARLGHRHVDRGAVHRRAAARRSARAGALRGGVVALAPGHAAVAGARRAVGRSAGASSSPLPALALPFVIRSSVIEGVATATEVSTIGIVYSLIVGLLIYRQFDWSRLAPMLVQTASLSGAILLIVGAATAMAWAITQSGFSQNLAHAIAPGAGRTVVVHRASRSWCSSCSAACWKACRRSCCSVR